MNNLNQNLFDTLTRIERDTKATGELLLAASVHKTLDAKSCQHHLNVFASLLEQYNEVATVAILTVPVGQPDGRQAAEVAERLTHFDERMGEFTRTYMPFVEHVARQITAK